MSKDAMRSVIWLAFFLGMIAGLWGGETSKKVSAFTAAMFAGVIGVIKWRRESAAIVRKYPEGDV